VVLSVDVDANGNVSNVNVAKSLGQDTRLSVRPEYSAPTVVKSLAAALDEKAVEAVKTWKFRPALRDGAPVAVRVSVDINFRTF
jgi:outer membrane biosynthesis protein TonB